MLLHGAGAAEGTTLNEFLPPGVTVLSDGRLTGMWPGGYRWICEDYRKWPPRTEPVEPDDDYRHDLKKEGT